VCDNHIIEVVEQYDAWLETLSEQQLKALASQVGVAEWDDLNAKRLRAVLSGNLDALQIFEDNIL